MKYYLIALVCLTGIFVKGQSVDIIFSPIMETEDSWRFLDNCAVVNELESRLPVKVELTVVSEEDGLVFSGVSTNKFIHPGLHNFTSLGLNISAFLPVYTSADYDGTFGSLRTSATGNLSVCLTAHLQYELPVSTKTCQDIGTKEFESLHLITPADESTIESEDFNFTWTPGSGMDLLHRRYYFKVIEIDFDELDKYKSGQFYSAKPFYEGFDLPVPVRQNEDLNLPYRTDKLYLWSAAIRKPGGLRWADEVWCFMLAVNSKPSRYVRPRNNAEESFVQLKREEPLGFVYEGEYSNDELTITVQGADKELDQHHTQMIVLPEPRPGPNKYEVDLRMYCRAVGVYLLTLKSRYGKIQYIRVSIENKNTRAEKKVHKGITE